MTHESTEISGCRHSKHCSTNAASAADAAYRTVCAQMMRILRMKYLADRGSSRDRESRRLRTSIGGN